MNISPKILILALVASLFSSCLKQSESISPIADVRTLAQLQRESMMNTALLAAGNNEMSKSTDATLDTNTGDPSIFYLNLKYNIVNMDVFETANISNSYEKVSNVFLKLFAQIFLKIAGSRTVKIGNIDLPIDELNLDFDIVKTFKVKRVYVEYNKEYNDSTGNKANFSFVKSFSLARVNGSGSQIINYNKGDNNCQYKCIEFHVTDGDIFDLVKSGKTIPLKPTLSISSLPAVEDLKLDGEIDLQIGLKLPF